MATMVCALHALKDCTVCFNANPPLWSGDAVNHPPHYAGGGIEVIDAIEAWELGFSLGNTVKYIARAGKKGDRLEDLRKAAWYLAREIAREEKLR